MAQVLAMTTPRPAGQTQRTEAKKVSPLVSVVSGAVAGASEAAITVGINLLFSGEDEIADELSSIPSNLPRPGFS